MQGFWTAQGPQGKTIPYRTHNSSQLGLVKEISDQYRETLSHTLDQITALQGRAQLQLERVPASLKTLQDSKEIALAFVSTKAAEARAAIHKLYEEKYNTVMSEQEKLATAFSTLEVTTTELRMLSQMSDHTLVANCHKLATLMELHPDIPAPSPSFALQCQGDLAISVMRQPDSLDPSLHAVIAVWDGPRGSCWSRSKDNLSVSHSGSDHTIITTSQAFTTRTYFEVNIERLSCCGGIGVIPQSAVQSGTVNLNTAFTTSGQCTYGYCSDGRTVCSSAEGSRAEVWGRGSRMGVLVDPDEGRVKFFCGGKLAALVVGVPHQPVVAALDFDATCTVKSVWAQFPPS
eukprot:TRINITY_DN4516_c0_g1_i5.p1 TRINITY_DN4516_c0_g1~~TRINITY_DN4516_c0_g1_i5.p1  ORF type:complete len:346 (-),score=53.33 TRINITY_DN4516_c0_g1_i5:67-1104(-)